MKMIGPTDRSTRLRKKMTDATFPKQCRLLNSTQYRHVFQRRLSVADHVLVVYGSENDLPTMRLGLAVSRRIGNAVVRNRWKRLIRESFRVHLRWLPQGVDIIVLPQRAREPRWDEVQQSLSRLVVRIVDRLRRDRGS